MTLRVKKIDELLPSNSVTLTKKTTDLNYNSPECVDLTVDTCTTPSVINGNRITRTQGRASVSKPKKDPKSQVKLEAFFQVASAVKMAPKKFKKSPKIKVDTTSVVVTNSRRKKLIKSDDEAKRKRISKDTSDAKAKNDTPPTVIPGVIDLCLDSDEEEDKKPVDKLPKTLKRPATVKSEKSKCPSYKVIEGTTFAVDGFRYGRIEGVTVYFLTHFHSDHYIGLTKKFSMPIYASKITANLMREFIPVDDKLVNILHLDTTITIDGVQVTAIDANHCPGAVMLLFQLPCGKRILHTGDFRASLEMELHPVLLQRNIDILYLDTTYISNKYSFHSQSKCVSDAIQLIREFKEKNEGRRILFVCGTYLVGKEKFWSPIATAFNFKVWTDDKRRKVIRAIDNDEILQRLVPNARQADLHVISLMKVGYKGIFEYWKEFSDSYDMVFALRPSGWEKNSRPQYRGEVNIIGVQYSEHSSHEEMRRFVGFLRPKEVISTVPSGKDLTKCSEVPLSWYKKECFSPIKKQSSIYDYLEVKQR